jgi:hypothetical protein
MAARRTSRRAVGTGATPSIMMVDRELPSRGGGGSRDLLSAVGSVFVGVGVVGGWLYISLGWMNLEEKLNGLEKLVATKEALAKVETAFVTKEALARVETEVKSLATKDALAKVELELKSLATKEAVGKVETELKNVLQSARLEGQNAALKAWMEKEASVAGGKASLGEG